MELPVVTLVHTPDWYAHVTLEYVVSSLYVALAPFPDVTLERYCPPKRITCEDGPKHVMVALLMGAGPVDVE